MQAEAVRVAVVAGDRAAAEEICAEAERFAPGSPEDPQRVVAVHCRGLLDRDPGLLAEAAAHYRDVCSALPYAQALEALADAWLGRGDLEQGRRALSEALGGYEVLGAVWDVDRVRARFRDIGLRRARRPQRRRAERGWDSLSPTELRVADLVADGLSNPKIAERLFLSRRTVQTHVSHILLKLDAKSRVDIAREAAARQGAGA